MNTIIQNNCNNIEVIPQSNDIAICWFNSIMTICLYSQGCRKVLLEASETWDKKNKILMILKRFIHKYYYKNENEIRNFFKKLSPEFLLLEFLRTFDIDFLELNKRNIHHIIYEGWYTTYMSCILRSLNINYKDIIITDKYKYQDLLEFININFILDKLKIHKRVPLKPISVNPDIILYSDKNNTSITTAINEGIKNNKNFLRINKFNESDIDNTRMDQEIIYKGEIYKLDACLLGNYNDNLIEGHLIAGITCNGKRYVFDGLKLKGNANPCKLFEYDWHINENKTFRINYNTCAIEEVIVEDNRYQLFSFFKNTRLLVYVKESYYNETIDDQLRVMFSKSTPNIDKKSLLDYIYNFNDLNAIVNKLKVVYKNDVQEIEQIKGNIRKLRDFIYMKLQVANDKTTIGKTKRSSKSPIQDTKKRKQ